ncbi:MAG TPA: polysaccharide deacetylase family protein [Candidatus Elarobacter sp.]|nr:polysaccharide deacetylase family protein [Candidatus Elarobacter sp.]
MLSHGRAAYRPSFARPPLAPFPGGARLALHLIVNVEVWDYARPMPRTALPAPAGGATVPDVPNFAWYQYGQRVGIWRLFETLAKHGARATLSINSSMCREYPQIVERAVADGWEMMAHGVVQRTMTTVDDERAVIDESLAEIETFTGKRPRGWLGPALVETSQTLDLLAEAGLQYCCDWGPADDLPFDLDVATGRLIAIPYPVDTNDIVVFAVDKHSTEELFTRCASALETLHAESAEQPRILAIALHPYLTGTAHRIAVLDRILTLARERYAACTMTAAELTDWYTAQTPR